MNLFVCGLRRSGTTILYDALGEDPELRCFYEPLREEAETIGGGSGARDATLGPRPASFASAFAPSATPSFRSSSSTGAAPGPPSSSSSPTYPSTSADCSPHLLAQAPEVAIKETRLHHKLGAIAEIDPDAAIVHLVRDPRAVTASMLLGRRRRTDIYPDAETFFTARTGRRLWSSRRISEELLGRAALARAARRHPRLPAAAGGLEGRVRDHGAATAGACSATATRWCGSRTCGPTRRGELERIYAADRAGDCRSGSPTGRGENIRRDAEIHLARRPALGAGGARCSGWSRSSRRPATARSWSSSRTREPLDLTPPAPRSRLSGFMGRAAGGGAEPLAA